MNTLIIPCAGKSSRFGGMPPKWMLYYPDGKPMVEKAICGLPLNQYDRVIVTAVKEHLENFNGVDLLKQSIGKKLGDKFELCILDEFTSCQAETVFNTIKKCKISGAFAVKDSDNFINMELPENRDFVVGLDMHLFQKEIERLSAKSFLVVNSQGIITDIVEKKIVSEFISIGMYGFRDAELFCEAFTSIADSKGMEREIYISHVISYLIGIKKSVYSYVETKDYEDWGTKKDWYNLLDRKKTYIINVEDIVTRNNKQIGMNMVYDEESIAVLRNIYENGSQIILLGNMKEDDIKKIDNDLKDKGIYVHASIGDVYLSHQVLLKKYSSAIPYPACEAINISEKQSFKDVIRDEK